MPEVIVAVRDLAAFCYRSGDIDYRFKPSPSAIQGIEGHQRVYRGRPASYQCEYAVEYRVPGHLLLRGRADGYDPEQGLVEEIKTCRVHPDTIPDSVSRLHMAQARLYAAMISAATGGIDLDVHLTWFNVDTEQEVVLEQRYTAEESQLFLTESLQRFSTWLDQVERIRKDRDSSLAGLSFPHREFRQGQRDIAELVYKCVDQGGQFLLEAPTGIGKTAAVLFPALKALASGKHERIAFMTAKSIGRKTAEETLALFSDAGYRGTAMSLTAREKICLAPGKACHGDDCPYAKSYYDKLPGAMMAAITQPVLRRDVIEALAQRFEVCPYQLSLDMLPWIDVIIGDYHHLFGLTSLLGAHVEGEQRWSALVDEAHNLPSRARQMFSAQLLKADLMSAKKQADSTLSRSLNRLNRALLELQKMPWQEVHFTSLEEIPAPLLDALREFVVDCAAGQASEAAYLHRQPLSLAFYFNVLQFLRVAEQWGEDFRCELVRDTGKQSLAIRLNCLDGGRLLASRHDDLHSLTAFSATLSPSHWMLSALGMPETAVFRRQTSPFSASQMQVFVASHVDTRFKQRPQSLGVLADVLRGWLRDVPGNCIVYFPSYRYMLDALDELKGRAQSLGGRDLWVQARDQRDTARDELLEKLESQRDVAAFCILGGVFGEGIDLPGERLSSVVVVGVGMPQVNRDTRQRSDYYGQRYGNGFEYAYLYPGMQKVDQALGRVIRTLGDQGRGLLIDSRYQRSEYRELLPPWWEYLSYAGEDSAAE